MKCPLIFIWMFLKIIWCIKRNPTSRFQGQQKLQFQLKINQAEKHSNSVPSQVVIPQVKKLTEVKPEQPEFKHIGGGAKTESSGAGEKTGERNEESPGGAVRREEQGEHHVFRKEEEAGGHQE